jgi:hypothetical protein
MPNAGDRLGALRDRLGQVRLGRARIAARGHVEAAQRKVQPRRGLAHLTQDQALRLQVAADLLQAGHALFRALHRQHQLVQRQRRALHLAAHLAQRLLELAGDGVGLGPLQRQQDEWGRRLLRLGRSRGHEDQRQQRYSG